MMEELEPEKRHKPVPICVDSTGVFNPVDHQSNKHIRIACHFSRELAAENVIAPQRIPTSENVADLLTKALPIATFKELVNKFVMALPKRD
jgi:hypothetical protein